MDDDVFSTRLDTIDRHMASISKRLSSIEIELMMINGRRPQIFEHWPPFEFDLTDDKIIRTHYNEADPVKVYIDE